jgi:SPP1 gp7 family putative phage head morphogenesis protein
VKWGAHEVDGRVAAQNAVKIRAALRQSIDAKQLFADYQLSQPHASGNMTQDRARARAWAIMNIRFNNDPLAATLIRLWAEAWILGDDAAGEALYYGRKTIKSVEAAVDWSKWKAGDRVASLMLRKPKAFQKILDDTGISLKGMDTTSMDRIGTALADSIELGLSPTSAAKLINNAVGNPARALTIAITETSRVLNTAAITRYKDAGVESMKWMTVLAVAGGSVACEICAPNNGVVVKVGVETFPSGNYQPPAHPHCRCALLPDFSEYESPTQHGVTDIALKPTLVERKVRDLYDGATSAERLRGTPKTAKEMSSALRNLKLSPKEVQAFVGYQEADFYKINRALRAGDVPQDLESQISIMDGVFARAPQVKGSIGEYYRTVDDDVLADLKKGDIFIEKGYMSTSVSKSEALQFGEDAMYGSKIRIIDTADAPKVWLDDITEAEGRSQKEVLFARDTPMTYVGKDKEGFHVFVTDKYADDITPVAKPVVVEKPAIDSLFEDLSDDDFANLGREFEEAVKDQPSISYRDFNRDVDRVEFEGYQLQNSKFMELVYKKKGEKQFTDHYEALSNYKTYGYRKINRWLRDKKLDAADEFTVKDNIKKIDEAMKAAPGLPEPLVTYRALNAEEFDALDTLLSDMKPGDSWLDKGYSSTTLDKKYAETFADGWLVKVENPAGTRGVMLDALKSKDKYVNMEAEWLLPRNTDFEVIAVNVEKRTMTVRVKK